MTSNISPVARKRSWTLRKEEERLINSFELWAWRRMLCVKWSDKRTNEWVREQVVVPEESGLLMRVKRRKLAKYGHWKRRPGSLPLRTIEYELPGPNKIGRPKTLWINNIDQWTVGGLAAARDCSCRRQRPLIMATAQ